MAKYSGAVGYALQVEVRPGYVTDAVIEKKCHGDVLLNQQRWQSADKANSDFAIDNSISIVANPFAYEHIGNIVYITWHGVRWKVQSLAVNRPRIVLQIGGGIYNGPEPTITSP
ncbi:MAG: hypothetical protein RSC06_11085 [Clostridia bacterium]